MSPSVAHAVLAVLALYLAAGLIVGVPFVLFGITRVDPAARGTGPAFRVLVFPGVVALWPLLARRWLAARGAR